jgi:hypothetical protein
MAAKTKVTECEACRLELEWNKVFDPRMDKIIAVICDATGKPEVDDEVWRAVHDVCYDLACAVLGFPGAPHCRAHGTPIPECENCPDCAALRSAPFKVIKGGRDN